MVELLFMVMVLLMALVRVIIHKQDYLQTQLGILKQMVLHTLMEQVQLIKVVLILLGQHL